MAYSGIPTFLNLEGQRRPASYVSKWEVPAIHTNQLPDIDGTVGNYAMVSNTPALF